jgi:hypothetical protein
VGMVYEVNSHCRCADYALNHPPGGWCKHQIARALTKRAAEILKNENGAGSEGGSPAPDSMGTTMKSKEYYTTNPEEGQVQRIDLVLAFEADEMIVSALFCLFEGFLLSEVAAGMAQCNGLGMFPREVMETLRGSFCRARGPTDLCHEPFFPSCRRRLFI